jgi:tRNA(Arg) A34 adenosine deaminase TadA
VGAGCKTVDHDPTLHGEVAAIRDACRQPAPTGRAATSCELRACEMPSPLSGNASAVFYANALADRLP